jgi:hypothetical protein
VNLSGRGLRYAESEADYIVERLRWSNRGECVTRAGRPPGRRLPGNNPNANQWEVVTVQSLVDQGLIISGAGIVDLNGNGLTCVMFPPGQGVPAGIPTIRDDTVPPTSP